MEMNVYRILHLNPFQEQIFSPNPLTLFPMREGETQRLPRSHLFPLTHQANTVSTLKGRITVGAALCGCPI
jgi:hypothetical protein